MSQLAYLNLTDDGRLDDSDQMPHAQSKAACRTRPLRSRR
jgi:hypothetical protein